MKVLLQQKQVTGSNNFPLIVIIKNFGRDDCALVIAFLLRTQDTAHFL